MGASFKVTDADKQRLLRFSLSVFFCFCCYYFNCLLQVLAHNRAELFFKKFPQMHSEEVRKLLILPDVGYDLLGDILVPKDENDWRYTLPDNSLKVLGLITVLRFSFFTKMRLTLWRRFFTILGTMFVFRGLSIYVTMLPNPAHACIPPPLSKNIWIAAWEVTSNKYFTCEDVMFSGHTVFLCMNGMMWLQYDGVVPLFGQDIPSHGGTRRQITEFVIWFIVCLGLVTIVGSHFHYTVDVFIGFSLTFFNWNLYHHYIDELFGKKDCLSRFLLWCEREAEDGHLDHSKRGYLPVDDY